MIRVFTDLDLLRPGEKAVEMLGLLDGDLIDVTNFPGRRNRYGKLIGNQSDCLQFVSKIEDCDFAVLPFGWGDTLSNPNRYRAAIDLIAKVQNLGKKTIVFYWSDNDEDIRLDSVLLFRTSLYRSRRGKNEFAMPAWSEDLLQYTDGIRFRQKQEKPTVGFCGFEHSRDLKSSARVLKKAIERILRFNRPFFTQSGIVRKQSLSFLQKSEMVQTHFVLRKHFGGIVPKGDLAQQDKALLANRKDFVANTTESDYVLCCRGSGNFSYRLYETMSCGRIPLIIDTDIVLPLEEMIPWDEFTLRVQAEDIRNLGARVAEHYRSLDETQFRAMQELSRNVWENFIEPSAYFSQLSKFLASLSN